MEIARSFLYGVKKSAAIPAIKPIAPAQSVALVSNSIQILAMPSSEKRLGPVFSTVRALLSKSSIHWMNCFGARLLPTELLSTDKRLFG